MRKAVWYFDFISPFAYFASLRLDEVAQRARLETKPVLFAALLDHWGQKGPAEIAAKREWTYRWCVWFARRHGIPLRVPAAHPFNPLPYLRLLIAAGGSDDALRTLFAALWTTGVDPADPEHLRALTLRLGVDPARLSAPEVKDTLRRNTEDAIRDGVFGVPTLVIDGARFWGADGLDFALDALADPALMDDPEMRRIATLPVGASRAAAKF